MDQLISLYERWIHIPRWQKWILILLVGLIFGGLLYYFKVAPLKAVLEQKREEAESLALTVNRLKVVEKRKALLLKELETLKKEIKQIESKLPTGREDVGQIIKSIADADSGMVIGAIVRESSKRHQYYIEYPYEVELIGSYPAFINWCEKLAKANRIINFGSFEIRSIFSESFRTIEKEKGTIPENASIKVRLKIKAFTLTE